MSWPAERFGPMRDLKGVGRGMTGSVYQTYDRSLGRTVAIKAIKRSILLTVSRSKWVNAASYARAASFSDSKAPRLNSLPWCLLAAHQFDVVVDFVAFNERQVKDVVRALWPPLPPSAQRSSSRRGSRISGK